MLILLVPVFTAIYCNQQTIRGGLSIGDKGTLYGSIVDFHSGILAERLPFHELGSSWLELAEELSPKCCALLLASTDHGSVQFMAPSVFVFISHSSLVCKIATWTMTMDGEDSFSVKRGR